MRIHDPFRWPLALCAPAFLSLPSVLAAQDDDCEEDDTPCERTACAIRTASQHEAQDDFWIGVASCINVTSRRESLACFRENAEALSEAMALLAAQFEARDDLCELLGGGRYAPEIDPRNFVESVTNPFFPLVPGQTKVFEKVTDEGTERIEVTTTHDTKRILGVECLVVQDTVTLDGVLIEDTEDYFAQDRAGNVWYFGELVMNFEDGELTDLGGSWRAGVDGARPGMIMKAMPAVGNVYRQEFLANEAEDAARVTALGRTVSVPFGVLKGCVETLDFTPLEPGHVERKFFAPGVGLVLEIDVETGERSELIAVF
jgi:hypothetical protein